MSSQMGPQRSILIKVAALFLTIMVVSFFWSSRTLIDASGSILPGGFSFIPDTASDNDSTPTVDDDVELLLSDVETIKGDPSTLQTGTPAEDLLEEYDVKAIRELCAGVKWQKGLVITHRDSTGGGLGNIRNAFLSSLRFAIEAGATGYVIPRMLFRDPCNLTNYGKNRDFSYLFDRAYYKHVLAQTCPQMTIYDDIDALSQYDWAAEDRRISLDPKSLDEHDMYTIQHAALWRSKFDTWLSSKRLGDFNTEHPVLIRFDHSFLLWPVRHDTPAVVRSFSQPLRFNHRIRSVAKKIIANMNDRFSLDVDMKAIKPGTFFGAHLRTDADVAGEWTSYEEQVKRYLSLATESGLKVIYCATGDAEHLAQFKAEAKEKHAIVVVSKDDLVPFGEDGEELESLSWDQKGAVDYEVMLASALYCGVSSSSFSYNLALKRHAMAGLMDGKDKDGKGVWGVNDSPLWWSEVANDAETGVVPNDGLSWLLGRGNMFLFAEALWP